MRKMKFLGLKCVVWGSGSGRVLIYHIIIKVNNNENSNMLETIVENGDFVEGVGMCKMKSLCLTRVS